MALRHPQRLAISLVAGAIAATWLLSGVAVGEAAWFVVFEALYVVLPGCLLYLTLSPDPGGRLRTLAIGWPLGYAIEVGAFALTAALHARWAFTLLPLLDVALIAWLLTGTRGRERLQAIRVRAPGTLNRGHRDVAGRSSSGLEPVFVAVAIGTALVLLALMSFTFFPLPGDIRSVAYFPDNVFVISLAAEARNHWPMTTPWVAGLPLHYYIAAFLHGAAINQVTGVSLATVYFRLFPTATTLLVSLQLWCLGRAMGRPRSAGPLAVVIFFVLGAATLSPAQAWPLEGNSLKFFWGSPTFAFGVVFLLALLSLMQRQLASRGTDDRRSEQGRAVFPSHDDRRALIVIAILVMGCGAAKTFAAADFVGGLGLYWLWSVATGRAFRLLSYSVFVSAICLGIVYFVMLSGGGAGTLGIQPLHPILGGALPAQARELAQSVAGHSILWILFLIIAAIGLVVCLSAPVLGAGWLLVRRSPLSSFESLCLAVVTTGFAGYMLFGGPGEGEFYFRNIGYFALVPVAAGGWACLWRDTPKDARRGIVGACGGVLVLGLAVAGGSRLLVLSRQADHRWYAAMYGLLALAIALVALGLSGRYAATIASRPSRALACCIPLVGVLGLVRPAAYAAVRTKATILHQRTAPADSPLAYGMNAALYRGLIWVRTHTRPCDVLAVNNHAGLAHDNHPSAYLFYSAFAERRVFLESWAFTPSGIVGKEPFPGRLALNDRAVVRGDPQALQELARLGVSYVLIDKTHGAGAPEPPSVSRLDEAVNGHGISTVRQAHQDSGASEADILRVVALPEALPFGVFCGIEDLPDVPGLVQLRVAFHVHELGSGRGDKGGMRRCRHRCHLFQKLQIFRMLAKLVIANQRAIRLAAEYSKLIFVNFLERRTLIELRGALEVPKKVLLGDFLHPDLQHCAGFTLADQIP